MAKKLSKTQKYKKNLKRKRNQQLQGTNTIKTVNENNKPAKEKVLVEKNKVKYNVVLNSKSPTSKPQIKAKKVSKKSTLVNKNKNKIIVKKTTKKTPIKNNKKNKFVSQNKVKQFFTFLKENTHIIFNSILILTFIILMIGLIRINVLKVGSIIYTACMIIFLGAIAISYNKYISGKIFTIILCLAMGAAIYHMQYTYDFIRSLNTSYYEFKTYYVVTFDNNSNKSIYTINNKKVGLMKDNSTNIERMLNTKLDKITYIEYKDMNSLFSDFFSQQFRALIVNENQYIYLKNNIEPNSRDVKILYEFKANSRK